METVPESLGALERMSAGLSSDFTYWAVTLMLAFASFLARGRTKWLRCLTLPPLILLMYEQATVESMWHKMWQFLALEGKKALIVLTAARISNSSILLLLCG